MRYGKRPAREYWVLHKKFYLIAMNMLNGDHGF